MKPVVAFAAALCAGTPASARSDPPPRLLVLGTPHFANHGRDIVNVDVADVRTPERQREIEAIVTRLAAFRPTRIAVEWDAEDQLRLDRRYADYRTERYVLSASEVDQIGLRLAARLGLGRVHAVGWNKSPPGADADYDFVAMAQAHEGGARWQEFVRRGQAEAEAEARLMTCTPVSSWLRHANAPDSRRAMHRPYFEIAGIRNDGADPGAAWVGAWYARNLRILNNLRALASAPGDRIVAIYGAGHAYLLDQQARESGGFVVADTLDWLPRSPRDAWTRCPE